MSRLSLVADLAFIVGAILVWTGLWMLLPLPWLLVAVGASVCLVALLVERLR